MLPPSTIRSQNVSSYENPCRNVRHSIVAGFDSFHGWARVLIILRRVNKRGMTSLAINIKKRKIQLINHSHLLLLFTYYNSIDGNIVVTESSVGQIWPWRSSDCWDFQQNRVKHAKLQLILGYSPKIQLLFALRTQFRREQHLWLPIVTHTVGARACGRRISARSCPTNLFQ